VYVFALLGKRWTGPIVAALTELGAAGLVVRTVDEGPPLRVSYRLTEAGGALRPALAQPAAWAGQHLPEADRNTTSSTV
jgi:DNA-binding HxlR family transcriptional regulator